MRRSGPRRPGGEGCCTTGGGESSCGKPTGNILAARSQSIGNLPHSLCAWHEIGGVDHAIALALTAIRACVANIGPPLDNPATVPVGEPRPV